MLDYLKIKCIKCKNLFTINSRQTKYCKPCKLEEQEILKLKQKINLEKIKPKKFCITCKIQLSKFSRKDKKYCSKCAKLQYNKIHNIYVKKKYKTIKLKTFYSKLLNILIDTPYLNKVI